MYSQACQMTEKNVIYPEATFSAGGRQMVCRRTACLRAKRQKTHLKVHSAIWKPTSYSCGTDTPEKRRYLHTCVSAAQFPLCTAGLALSILASP